MSPPTVRLFYVDDSGAEQTGWAVYSWVECTAAGWRAGLRDWLHVRKALYREYEIPADYELHASPFVGGRGNPSQDPSWNRQKHLRALAAEQALAALSASTHIRIGTTYRHHTGRHHKHAMATAELYAATVQHLDSRLAAAEEFGLLIVDGNGTDGTYRGAHRALKLEHRHVIEDPLFQDSHVSQWVQMADLVAYAAYQHLLRAPGKEFAWHWYDHYLRSSDTNGGPIELVIDRPCAGEHDGRIEPRG